MSEALGDDDAIIKRLRDWLKGRNPKLTDKDLDVDNDLIATRVVDSLSSLDFILFIEELAGCEIETSSPDATANFRTLRTIRRVFFSHVDAAAADKPSAKKSLSVLPPKLGGTLSSAARTRRPLTASQARYWYLQKARPETAWNVPAVMRITGPLDLSVLRQCLSEVVRRHDGLRTKFEVVDGVPMQVIVPPFVPEMPVVELAAAPGADLWLEALKIVERECAVKCDPTAAPPWHVRIVRMKEDDHVCLIALEHLIADLESLMTIPRELARLYAAHTENRAASLAVPPMQWSDFSDWHGEWLATEGAREQIAYRQKQFADAKPIDFGTGGRTATTSARDGYQRLISPENTARLEALAADESATPVVVAMSAVATMLHRRFHQSDIVLMAVSSYRSAGRGTTGVIGNFTNQLPLRLKVTPSLTFRDLMREVRAQVIDAFKHRDVPTQLVFGTENPLDHPLAAVLVNWMNLVDYGDGMAELRIKDTTMKPVMLGVGGASSAPMHGGNPPFATLIVRAARAPTGTSLFVTTADEILPRGSAKKIGDELTSILEAVAANPNFLVGA